MATQTALIIQGPQKVALVADQPIPSSLRPDYVRVRTVAVALNPCDWKHVDYLGVPGVKLGCDYAGIVEAVGPEVKRPLKRGDRICGFAHGANAVFPDDGAFSQVIDVKGDVQIRMPDSLSFEEAATLGVGVGTLGLGMYKNLGLAWPNTPLDKGETVPILIYGGSTATGTLAIQFAKVSGYTVYTTCSPKNFALVRKLGADAVFDYHDPTSPSQIRKLSKNKLHIAFDTISDVSSAKFCNEALSTEKGGEYGHVNNLPADVIRSDLKSSFTGAFTIMGEDFVYGDVRYPAVPEDKRFAEEFFPVVEGLLAQGKIVAHPPLVGAGGLQGAIDGMQLMREGKVSAQKLVYRVRETPSIARFSARL